MSLAIASRESLIRETHSFCYWHGLVSQLIVLLFSIVAEVFLTYNGEWKIAADGARSFCAKSCKTFDIPKNTTFAELVDIIYHLINVEKSVYDLLIQVNYHVPPNLPPVVIDQDHDLATYLSRLISGRTLSPLCVSLVEKSPLTYPSHDIVLPALTRKTIPGVVPEMSQQVVFESQNEGGGEENFLHHYELLSDLQATTSAAPAIARTPHLSSFPSTDVSSIPTPQESFGMALSTQTVLEAGVLFDNKKELQLRLYKYAMTNHFEFNVEKSTKHLWYVKCVDDNCKWRLRALKAKFSEMFEIRKFEQHHSCSILTRQEKKMQTPSWVIGECIKSKYMDHHHDHMPKKIMEDMHTSFGIDMTYNKAWRSREQALMAVRGTVEESYCKLPSYLYMLEKNNPGTITDIQTDELGHFRYMFMSLGLSIRGFKTCCRPVLCVDASFLKHKVGGQLLVAIALDANEQLFPVAFGVVDSENNNSWTYFMQKLRDAIGLVDDLVFVSDRHPSIANALCTVFPEAEHGACTYHIKMNVMAKFKTDNCHAEFDLASRAYTASNFYRHFERIRVKDHRIAAYLEEIGFQRWSRAFFPGKRYNQLTSNYAESFNSQSRHARKYPITTMADYLRHTIQHWFHDRREKACNHEERLSPNYEKLIRDQFEKGIFYNVSPLNRFEFSVHDSESHFKVNLKDKTCTCRVFEVSGLPCSHALAAARNRDFVPYDYCSRYYTTESWLNTYAETCYPVGDEVDWDIPEIIKQRVCLKPPVKVKKGRTITKRRPSQGEVRKVPRRCSSCGGQGHNRATCKAVMPAPSTARALSSQQHESSSQQYEPLA